MGGGTGLGGNTTGGGGAPHPPNNWQPWTEMQKDRQQTHTHLRLDYFIISLNILTPHDSLAPDLPIYLWKSLVVPGPCILQGPAFAGGRVSFGGLWGGGVSLALLIL